MPYIFEFLFVLLGLSFLILIRFLYVLRTLRIEKKQLADELYEYATTKNNLEKEAIQLQERVRTLEGVHSQLQTFQEKYYESENQRRELKVTLDKEKENHEEKIAILQDIQLKLSDQFKALSSEALRTNNQSFLELARESFSSLYNKTQDELQHRHKAVENIVMPLQQALKEVDHKIHDLEKNRVGAYEQLKEQITSLNQGQKSLTIETSNLVKALRAPTVRGQWGEMQLKRVVEMAGMLNYCDFVEQKNVEGEFGRLRPDMVVNLPGGKKIVIDAKAPLSAYLEAKEAGEDGERKSFLKQHARQIRQHIKNLSSKNYWDQINLQPAPEFVILFIPGEVFFSAALEQDPALIEAGVEDKVILATPTTLIALLRAVSYGWRQEIITENAQEISRLGKELYKRLSDLGNHFTRLGKNITQVVDSYNQSIATLERRVLPSARRFNQLQSSEAEENSIETTPVDKTIRSLNSPELLSINTSENDDGGK